MTTRFKTLLTIFVLVSLVGVYIFWQGDLVDNQKTLFKPTNGINKSYHNDGYENAWILDIDKNMGLVLIKTVDSKMSIIFKPTATNLLKFRIGSIAPVTFQCSKEKNGKCDLSAPYELFIRNDLVELKELKF